MLLSRMLQWHFLCDLTTTCWETGTAFRHTHTHGYSEMSLSRVEIALNLFARSIRLQLKASGHTQHHVHQQFDARPENEHGHEC